MLIEMQMRLKNQPSRLHKPQLGTAFQAQKRCDYDALCRNCDILALFSGLLWQFEFSTAGRILGCFLQSIQHLRNFEIRSLVSKTRVQGVTNANRQV